MSGTSTSTWRCVNPTCRAPLGTVLRDRALELVAANVILDPRSGVARIRCPICSSVRVWAPHDH